MRIKPSSANSKKPLISDKPTQPKKPTIVKCFICNQMFYSQQTFDTHMDQHQKKVNKNLPEQIQRKTMESFGLKRKDSITKKNSTLQAINQNQIKDKKLLNKTLKTPIIFNQPQQNPFITSLQQTKSSMLKKPSVKSQQLSTKKQQNQRKSQSPSKKQSPDREIQEIDEAIKESTLLMDHIMFLTQQGNQQEELIKGEEVHSEEEDQHEETQKTVTQTQFVHAMQNNNWSLSKIEQQLLKVDFNHHKSLENCQIQVQYLKKVIKMSNDTKFLQSISKTKSKILSQVISIIMQLDNSSFKKPQKPQNKISQKQIRQQENSQARTCSECLDMIGFGENCIIKESQFFHKNCFLQKNN